METEEKDYLYYFWNPHHEDWLREFAPLEKDKALKGVTPYGITESKKEVDKEDDRPIAGIHLTRYGIRIYRRES